LPGEEANPVSRVKFVPSRLKNCLVGTSRICFRRIGVDRSQAFDELER
jgi:hypothetical protein